MYRITWSKYGDDKRYVSHFPSFQNFVQIKPHDVKVLQVEFVGGGKN